MQQPKYPKAASEAAWNAIIGYVNAEPGSTEAHERFLELFVTGLHWVGGNSNYIFVCRDFQNRNLLDALNDPDFVNMHRQSLNEVLAWLADPKGEREIAINAVEMIQTLSIMVCSPRILAC